MKFSFTILLLLVAGLSFSQPAWVNYNTSNSPLPDNTVRCLATDAQHTLWIGTDFGLASLHDTTWTIYQTGNSGLPNNSIRSIYIDKQQNKWIGTFNGGVARFDDSLWTVYNTTNSGLPSDFVKGIAVDSLGRQWFTTISGMAMLDDTTWTVYDMFNSPLMSNNLTSIYLDKNDEKTIGSLNGGMAILQDTTWNIFTIQNSGIQDNTVLCIGKDTINNTWLGMPTGGLMAYVPGNPWLWYHTGNGNIQSNSINALRVAPDQRIWLGSQDAGLIVKNGINFTSYNTSNSAIPDNYLYSVELDTGLVWAGTSTSGLVRFDESLLSAVEQLTLQNTPLIYPNPCRSSHVFVQTAGSGIRSIRLLDATGKMQHIFFSCEGSHWKADVSALPAGLYFLRIANDHDAVYFQKLIRIK